MIITMTKQNQPEVEMSKKPVVIDVFATWCGPCMEMKPIFEELAAKHANQYTFVELNVDESRDLAIHYGVTSVPTFIFMKDGKVQGKKTGYMSGEDLLDTMAEYFGQ
jgi:thioredoxin 1